MSNKTSSGFGIPASSALFLILVLGIGALILIGSNIDPRAGVRAQFTAIPTITATPPDLFANITYTAFRSEDGAIEFERPAAWTEIPMQQAFQYMFAPVNPDGSSSDISRLEIILLPIIGLGSPNLTSDSTPEAILQEIVQANPNAQASEITLEEIRGLSGASVRLAQTVSNQGANEERVAEFVVLSVGEGYVALIDAITVNSNASRMDTVMQQVKNTFKLNRDVAIAGLKAAYPVATTAPAATLVPTATVEAAATTAP